MAKNNKCSMHLGLESDSSGTEAEISSISDQRAPASNTGLLKTPEDTKTPNSPNDVDIDSPTKSSLLPPPIHQDRHSLPTYLHLSLPAHQGIRRSLPTSLSVPHPTSRGVHSSSKLLKKPEVDSLSPNSRNESENKKSPIQLEIESDESSETEAEAPVTPEKPPQTVSSSNEEQPAEFCTKTMPKLIDNTSSTIAEPLPSVHQHAQEKHTDSVMERTPSTSRNKSPRKVKQSYEDLDQPLVDKVQKLELESKTKSPEGMSKCPSKGHYIKSKGNNDQTWSLPFRVRKTGLISVWNEPDEDLVPNLAMQKGIRATSIPQQNEEAYQGTLLDFQCQQCKRAILRDSLELLCQQCLDELQRGASAPQEPEGACGGAALDPHNFLEGATASPYEEEFPRSYSDFKATYERMNSVERYIRMRHRQREGLPPYDKPLQGATQQFEDAYGDYERSDSEEDYRRMHHLQREMLGVLPPTQHDIFEEMRLAEFEIFSAMSRPGETFEDLRNPEQEILEAQHYDRQMAKLAARFGGAPLEDTTFPWKPQEFLDQETLYELWRPPTDLLEKDEVEDMSPEIRRRHELERMALMRKPREDVEELLGKKDESEGNGPESEDEDTEYSEDSLPSGSTD